MAEVDASIESLTICLCLVQMRVRVNATIAICAGWTWTRIYTHSVHRRYARCAIYCSAEQMAEGTQYRNIRIERTATKRAPAIGVFQFVLACSCFCVRVCVCALFILNLSWFSIWYLCLLACSLLSGWDARHDCQCALCVRVERNSNDFICRKIFIVRFFQWKSAEREHSDAYKRTHRTQYGHTLFACTFCGLCSALDSLVLLPIARVLSSKLRQ